MLDRHTRDKQIQHQITELAQRGATLVPQAVPHNVCDAVREQYAEHCRNDPTAAAVADQQGHHPRLSNFHLVSEAALAIGLNPRLGEILDVLFGYKACIYSCLTFEKSTQQRLHRDSPFFRTEPAGFFFGVWTALEDIHPKSGPLVYYLGGHRVNVDAPAMAAQVLERDPGAAVYEAYLDAVEGECVRAGLSKTSPVMRKGDTLIWHPDLPHGGGAIEDPALTRASIVFHYTPERVPVFGPDVFFGWEQADPDKELALGARDGRQFVIGGDVRFFTD